MYPKMKVMRSERHSDLEEAVHKRLSRKQLPRVTDDGYVEYGLRVPQDILMPVFNAYFTNLTYVL